MTVVSKSARIAFLGLGKMGLPMANRLTAEGYQVVGFDPFEAARTAFASRGGSIVQTAAEAAQGANVLITMLPDGKSVENALVGRDDLASRLASGAIVIDMSSSAPLGTRDLATLLEKRGVTLLDAPVSGGVKRAIDGSLAIMAAAARRSPLCVHCSK